VASIGRFGKPRPVAEALTFEFFDDEYRTNPLFSEVALIDFMEEAADIDEKSARAYAFLKDALRQTVHPDDFAAFWSVALAERQETEDLLEIFQSVSRSLTDRPTSRSSVSTDGPSSTDTSSEDGSSSQVIARLESNGRPDLALMVTRAQRSA